MIEGPRAAKVEELPQIVKLTSWIFGFERVGARMDEAFPHFLNESNIENLRVIVSDGKVVSHVGFWEGWLNLYGCWVKAGLVGAVCTHPDYRNRGYASALVRDAFRKMREDGVDFVMVSGKRTLYSRAGCVEAGKVYRFRTRSSALTIFEDVEVKPYTEDKVMDLVTLYQREPVRFKRSLDEFKLLAGRRILEGAAKVRHLVAYKRRRPIAYVSALEFKRAWSLVEYAGSRRAVLRMISDLSRTSNIDTFELNIPYGDWEMLSLLEDMGLKPHTSIAPASLAILNPKKFAEKIRLYVEERIGDVEFMVEPKQDGVRIRLSDSRLELRDPREFTLLVFGRPETVENPDTPDFDPDSVPEPFKTVFPMPTPTYGLNYI